MDISSCLNTQILMEELYVLRGVPAGFRLRFCNSRAGEEPVSSKKDGNNILANKDETLRGASNLRKWKQR